VRIDPPPDGEPVETEQIAFLTVEQVVLLHEESIRRYSSGESAALRDPGLLESAVMNPRQTFGGDYLYDSLAAMSAAYLIGLCQNHAFENGNKRVAFAACATFLRLNGWQLTLTQDEAVDLTLRVAERRIDRDEVVAVLEGKALLL